MAIKQFIYKYLWWTYRPIKSWIWQYRAVQHMEAEINRLENIGKSQRDRIFYLGITEQPNLGDMGQHFCITNWLKENYPERQLVMFESSVITNKKSRFINVFRTIFKPTDIIVFQSGYCTQDLGGDHTLLHQLIIDAFPDAFILMMPQTIYFKSEENRRICAENHRQAKNMLFLARDFLSYEQAKMMFPNVHVEAFPDIVTTLIGKYSFANKRCGVCICTRNDEEKFYSDQEIAYLTERIKNDGTNVLNKDTQGKRPFEEIRANLKQFIEDEIESYSHFNVTITDRYHGTIFSLCAGTPVIIIKTTDHKVTTGADWFKGVYDDYVFVVDNLDEAYEVYLKIMKKDYNHNMNPYFKTAYYDKLKSKFTKIYS